MRVVIDARESGTGTGRYVDKLIEYLHKQKPGFEIVVITKPARVKFIKTTAPSFEVVETTYKEFSFGEQLGFAWQLYRLKPDLVHFGMTHQPVLYLKKSVTTVHDLTTARFYNPAKNWLIFKLKQWVYRVVIWVVAHKSKRIIAPSEFVKQDLAAYTHLDLVKIKVTYEAADKITDQARPIKELEGKQFLLYVGRAQPHKNLKRLIEAFQELKWIYPDLALVLAGKIDGSSERLQRYVQNKKAGDVMFVGFVDEGSLRWLYEHAAAYVFPSLSEGFGLPALEAMNHGLPVASSKATCLPEIYKDAAIYFDPFSVHDMAEKIKSALDDKQLAGELAKKGREVAGSYSWQRMAEQTIEVYTEILNK